MERKGIDVSQYQGKIDWELVKYQGIQFAILCSGIGCRKDNQLYQNGMGAVSNGIPIGIYHCGQAANADEAFREAEFCLKSIQSIPVCYPVAYDCSRLWHLGMDQEQINGVCSVFAMKVKLEGYFPSIFDFSHRWNQGLKMCSEHCCARWVADYQIEPPDIVQPYTIWQYSCTGRVAGVPKNVGLNLCYRDYTDFSIDVCELGNQE